MNDALPLVIGGGALAALGMVSWLGYRAGYHAGWTDRHQQMIVSAKSRQWASDNRIER